MSTKKIEFPENATIGDLYKPAMGIHSKKEAKVYFEALVEHMMEHANDPKHKARTNAVSVVKQNLGYFAGYYDVETMARVNKLFSTTHPVFGDTVPTAEGAFEMGGKWAKGELDEL